MDHQHRSQNERCDINIEQGKLEHDFSFFKKGERSHQNCILPSSALASLNSFTVRLRSTASLNSEAEQFRSTTWLNPEVSLDSPSAKPLNYYLQ